MIQNYYDVPAVLTDENKGIILLNSVITFNNQLHTLTD